MRAPVAVALLLAACAPERDYTLTECPSAQALTAVSGQNVCDRGLGASPRFVSVEDCAREAGGVISAAFSCSHPNRDPCPESSPHLFFCSYDSVAAAVGR